MVKIKGVDRTIVICFLLIASRFGWAGQTYDVTSTLDEIDADTSDGVCETAAHTCTLRAAVMQASAAGGAAVSVNLPAGTYLLTRPIDGTGSENGGSLKLAPPSNGMTTVSIVGASAETTIIDAGQIDRVFSIEFPRVATFSNITVRNGYALTDVGGGIFDDGFLTLDHVIVSGNQADYGGGVYNGQGTLSIDASSIVSNVATQSGGGVFSLDPLTITASTLANNAAMRGGGLEVRDSSIIVNTTIANNYATDSGGGLYAMQDNGTATNLYNSTVAYNEADSDQNNVGSGGGIGVDAAKGNLNIYNTLVAGNFHINPAFADDCAGPLRTHAFNLFGNISQCAITQVSGTYAILNTLTYLGPLQDNGGPTATIALLPGSNAIDGAAQTCLDAYSNPIVTDQRAFPRDLGRCDIGAFEFDSVDQHDLIFQDGFELPPPPVH